MLLAVALNTSLLSDRVSTSQNTIATQSAETSSADASSADGSSTDKTGKSAAESSADSASHTIGVGQFAEHDSLDNYREGFTADLEEKGIEEGVNLAVPYDNSQADGGTASQIATNFIGKGVDLICDIVTPMVQTEYGMAKRLDTPATFITVTSPVAAELAGTNSTPAGGVIDTSDKLPVEAQLEVIREILLEAKDTGIIYTTGGVNSESAIAEYGELAPQYGLEIVDIGTSSSADITLVVDTPINKVDYITNLTDSTVVISPPIILNKVVIKNILVFGSEIEQVKIECLATVGLDYIELGRQIGETATQVLHGEKKVSEMNYGTIKEAAFYGNIRVIRNLGIILSGDLTENVAELFTETAQ